MHCANHRISSWIRCTAIATVLAFVHTAVFAEPLLGVTSLVREQAEARRIMEKADGYFLPYRYGRIVDGRHVPGSRRLVVCVQDLHCHPEVQRNISEIIRTFDQRYGVGRICVEGAPAGKVDTALLATIPEPEVRRKTLDALMAKGVLTGAEYYVASNGLDNLYGLEDWPLYSENVERARLLIDGRERLLGVADRLSEDIRALKSRYLARDLRRLERRLSPRSRAGSGNARSYRELARLCRRHGVDLEQYPNLAKYVRLTALGNGLRYRRLTGELKRYDAELKRALPYAEYRRLQELLSGDRREEYYLALAETAGRRAPPARRYPELSRFFSYLSLNYAINPVHLTLEEKFLRDNLLAAAARRSIDRELLFLSSMAGYLRDYLELRITREEFSYFSEHREDFAALLSKYFTGGEVGEALACLNDRTADDFYAVNIRRNGVFADAVADGTRRSAADDPGRREPGYAPVLRNLADYEDITVMVSGGFHLGVGEQLGEQGCSYLAVMPNVTKEHDAGLYEKMLTGEFDVRDIASSALANKLLSVYDAKAVKTLAYAMLHASDLDARRAVDILGRWAERNNRDGVEMTVTLRGDILAVSVNAERWELAVRDGKLVDLEETVGGTREKSFWFTLAGAVVPLAVAAWAVREFPLPGLFLSGLLADPFIHFGRQAALMLGNGGAARHALIGEFAGKREISEYLEGRTPFERFRALRAPVLRGADGELYVNRSVLAGMSPDEQRTLLDHERFHGEFPGTRLGTLAARLPAGFSCALEELVVGFREYAAYSPVLNAVRWLRLAIAVRVPRPVTQTLDAARIAPSRASAARPVNVGDGPVPTLLADTAGEYLALLLLAAVAPVLAMAGGLQGLEADLPSLFAGLAAGKALSVRYVDEQGPFTEPLREYLELIRGIVNPGREEHTAVYIGCGGDIATAVASTDARRFIMVDQNPFHAALRGRPAEIRGQYLREKRARSYSHADILRRVIGCAYYPFLWELESLGAVVSDPEEVRDPATGRTLYHRLAFKLPGDSEERELLYYTVKDASSLGYYPEHLLGRLRDGFDAVVVKAFEPSFLSFDVQRLLFDNLRRGGYVLTDDPKRCVNDMPGALRDLRADGKLDFLIPAERSPDARFGYGIVRVFRKGRETERGFLAKAVRSYFMLIRGTVNPAGAGGTACYIGSGPDISTSQLATGARRHVFVDRIPFRSAPPDGLEELRRAYVREKRTESHSFAKLLERIGSAYYPLLWELEELGAEVRAATEGAAAQGTIRYRLPGDAEDRELAYFSVPDANDTAAYPPELSALLDEGIEFVIAKGFHKVRLSRGLQELLVSRLRPGGFILTDQPRLTVPEYYGLFEDLRRTGGMKDIMAFEKGHDVKFGYNRLTLLRKLRDGGPAPLDPWRYFISLAALLIPFIASPEAFAGVSSPGAGFSTVFGAVSPVPVLLAAAGMGAVMLAGIAGGGTKGRAQPRTLDDLLVKVRETERGLGLPAGSVIIYGGAVRDYLSGKRELADLSDVDILIHDDYRDAYDSYLTILREFERDLGLPPGSTLNRPRDGRSPGLWFDFLGFYPGPDQPPQLMFAGESINALGMYLEPGGNGIAYYDPYGLLEGIRSGRDKTFRILGDTVDYREVLRAIRFHQSGYPYGDRKTQELVSGYFRRDPATAADQRLRDWRAGAERAAGEGSSAAWDGMNISIDLANGTVSGKDPFFLGYHLLRIFRDARDFDKAAGELEETGFGPYIRLSGIDLRELRGQWERFRAAGTTSPGEGAVAMLDAVTARLRSAAARGLPGIVPFQDGFWRDLFNASGYGEYLERMQPYIRFASKPYAVHDEPKARQLLLDVISLFEEYRAALSRGDGHDFLQELRRTEFRRLLSRTAGYLELIRKRVNPLNARETAVYFWSGGDIIGAVLATGARELVFADRQPFFRMLSPAEENELKTRYLRTKLEASFADVRDIEKIGCAYYPLRWELELLGAEIGEPEAVRDPETGEPVAHRLSFRLPGDNGDRVLYYYACNLDNGNDVVRDHPALARHVRQGTDFVVLKAFMNKRVDPRVQELLVESLREDGYVITDDPELAVPGFLDRFSREREPDELIEYWQAYGTKFGYRRAALLRKLRAGGPVGLQGAQSATSLSYFDLIRRQVNPGNGPKTVLYPGSAGDISSALTATGGRRYIFIDGLPFRTALKTADPEALRKAYLENKRQDSYSYVGASKRRLGDLDTIGCAYYPLLWELEGMGATVREPETVRDPETGKTLYHRLAFRLPEDTGDREVLYYEFEFGDGDALFLERPDIVARLREGVDLLVMKAFMNKQLDFDIQELFFDSLRDDGWLITDEPQSALSEFLDELIDVRALDEIRGLAEFERSYGAKFGYGKACLIRKRETVVSGRRPYSLGWDLRAFTLSALGAAAFAALSLLAPGSNAPATLLEAAGMGLFGVNVLYALFYGGRYALAQRLAGTAPRHYFVNPVLERDVRARIVQAAAQRGRAVRVEFVDRLSNAGDDVWLASTGVEEGETVVKGARWLVAESMSVRFRLLRALLLPSIITHEGEFRVRGRGDGVTFLFEPAGALKNLSVAITTYLNTEVKRMVFGTGGGSNKTAVVGAVRFDVREYLDFLFGELKGKLARDGDFHRDRRELYAELAGDIETFVRPNLEASLRRGENFKNSWTKFVKDFEKHRKDRQSPAEDIAAMASMLRKEIYIRLGSQAWEWYSRKFDGLEADRFAIVTNDDIFLEFTLHRVIKDPRIAGILPYGQATRGSHWHMAVRDAGKIAVYGVPAQELDGIRDGDVLVLGDGEGGFILRPDGRTVGAYERLIDEQGTLEDYYRGAARETATTGLGHVIGISADTSDAEGIRSAVTFGADSFNLIRTEYLYADRRTRPGVDELKKAFLAMAVGAAGRAVTFRVFDWNRRDKNIRCLPESRDNEGFAYIMREGRTAAKEELQAILHACLEHPHGSIMFPMIAGARDADDARAIVDEVIREMSGNLRPEDVERLKGVKIGFMIETKSAVEEIDAIMERAAFVNIGLSDLTASVFAIGSRDARKNASYYDNLQPEVLRAVVTVLGAAGKHRVPVCICGNLSGTHKFLPFIIAAAAELDMRLGVNVPGDAIPLTKLLVRSIPPDKARALFSFLFRPGAPVPGSEQLTARSRDLYKEAEKKLRREKRLMSGFTLTVAAALGLVLTASRAFAGQAGAPGGVPALAVKASVFVIALLSLRFGGRVLGYVRAILSKAGDGLRARAIENLVWRRRAKLRETADAGIDREIADFEREYLSLYDRLSNERARRDATLRAVETLNAVLKDRGFLVMPSLIVYPGERRLILFRIDGEEQRYTDRGPVDVYALVPVTPPELGRLRGALGQSLPLSDYVVEFPGLIASPTRRTVSPSELHRDVFTQAPRINRLFERLAGALPPDKAAGALRESTIAHELEHERRRRMLQVRGGRRIYYEMDIDEMLAEFAAMQAGEPFHVIARILHAAVMEKETPHIRYMRDILYRLTGAGNLRDMLPALEQLAAGDPEDVRSRVRALYDRAEEAWREHYRPVLERRERHSFIRGLSSLARLFPSSPDYASFLSLVPLPPFAGPGTAVARPGRLNEESGEPLEGPDEKAGELSGKPARRVLRLISTVLKHSIVFLLFPALAFAGQESSSATSSWMMMLVRDLVFGDPLVAVLLYSALSIMKVKWVDGMLGKHLKNVALRTSLCAVPMAAAAWISVHMLAQRPAAVTGHSMDLTALVLSFAVSLLILYEVQREMGSKANGLSEEYENKLRNARDERGVERVLREFEAGLFKMGNSYSTYFTGTRMDRAFERISNAAFSRDLMIVPNLEWKPGEPYFVLYRITRRETKDSDQGPIEVLTVQQVTTLPDGRTNGFPVFTSKLNDSVVFCPGQADVLFLKLYGQTAPDDFDWMMRQTLDNHWEGLISRLTREGIDDDSVLASLEEGVLDFALEYERRRRMLEAAGRSMGEEDREMVALMAHAAAMRVADPSCFILYHLLDPAATAAGEQPREDGILRRMTSAAAPGEAARELERLLGDRDALHERIDRLNRALENEWRQRYGGTSPAAARGYHRGSRERAGRGTFAGSDSISVRLLGPISRAKYFLLTPALALAGVLFTPAETAGADLSTLERVAALVALTAKGLGAAGALALSAAALFIARGHYVRIRAGILCRRYEKLLAAAEVPEADVLIARFEADIRALQARYPHAFSSIGVAWLRERLNRTLVRNGMLLRSRDDVNEERIFVLFRIVEERKRDTDQGTVTAYLIDQVTRLGGGRLFGSVGESFSGVDYVEVFPRMIETGIFDEYFERYRNGLPPDMRLHDNLAGHRETFSRALRALATRLPERSHTTKIMIEDVINHEIEHERRRRMAVIRRQDLARLDIPSDEKVAALRELLESENMLPCLFTLMIDTLEGFGLHENAHSIQILRELTGGGNIKDAFMKMANLSEQERGMLPFRAWKAYARAGESWRRNNRSALERKWKRVLKGVRNFDALAQLLRTTGIASDEDREAMIELVERVRAGEADPAEITRLDGEFGAPFKGLERKVRELMNRRSFFTRLLASIARAGLFSLVPVMPLGDQAADGAFSAAVPHGMGAAYFLLFTGLLLLPVIILGSRRRQPAGAALERDTGRLTDKHRLILGRTPEAGMDEAVAGFERDLRTLLSRAGTERREEVMSAALSDLNRGLMSRGLFIAANLVPRTGERNFLLFRITGRETRPTDQGPVDVLTLRQMTPLALGMMRGYGQSPLLDDYVLVYPESIYLTENAPLSIPSPDPAWASLRERIMSVAVRLRARLPLLDSSSVLRENTVIHELEHERRRRMLALDGERRVHYDFACDELLAECASFVDGNPFPRLSRLLLLAASTDDVPYARHFREILFRLTDTRSMPEMLDRLERFAAGDIEQVRGRARELYRSAEEEWRRFHRAQLARKARSLGEGGAVAARQFAPLLRAGMFVLALMLSIPALAFAGQDGALNATLSLPAAEASRMLLAAAAGLAAVWSSRLAVPASPGTRSRPVITRKDTFEGRNNDIINFLTASPLFWEKAGFEPGEFPGFTVVDVGVGAMPFVTAELVEALRKRYPGTRFNAWATELPAATPVLQVVVGDIPAVREAVARARRLDPGSIVDVRLSVNRDLEPIELLAGHRNRVGRLRYITAAVAPDTKIVGSGGESVESRYDGLFRGVVTALGGDARLRDLIAEASGRGTGSYRINGAVVRVERDPVRAFLAGHDIAFAAERDPARAGIRDARLVFAGNVTVHLSASDLRRFKEMMAGAMAEGGLLLLKNTRSDGDLAFDDLELYRRQDGKLVPAGIRRDDLVRDVETYKRDRVKTLLRGIAAVNANMDAAVRESLDAALIRRMEDIYTTSDELAAFINGLATVFEPRRTGEAPREYARRVMEALGPASGAVEEVLASLEGMRDPAAGFEHFAAVLDKVKVWLLREPFAEPALRYAADAVALLERAADLTPTAAGRAAELIATIAGKSGRDAAVAFRPLAQLTLGVREGAIDEAVANPELLLAVARVDTLKGYRIGNDAYQNADHCGKCFSALSRLGAAAKRAAATEIASRMRETLDSPLLLRVVERAGAMAPGALNALAQLIEAVAAGGLAPVLLDAGMLGRATAVIRGYRLSDGYRFILHLGRLARDSGAGRLPRERFTVDHALKLLESGKDMTTAELRYHLQDLKRDERGVFDEFVRRLGGPAAERGDGTAGGLDVWGLAGTVTRALFPSKTTYDFVKQAEFGAPGLQGRPLLVTGEARGRESLEDLVERLRYLKAGGAAGLGISLMSGDSVVVESGEGMGPVHFERALSEGRLVRVMGRGRGLGDGYPVTLPLTVAGRVEQRAVLLELYLAEYADAEGVRYPVIYLRDSEGLLASADAVAVERMLALRAGTLELLRELRERGRDELVTLIAGVTGSRLPPSGVLDGVGLVNPAAVTDGYRTDRALAEPAYAFVPCRTASADDVTMPAEWFERLGIDARACAGTDGNVSLDLLRRMTPDTVFAEWAFNGDTAAWLLADLWSVQRRKISWFDTMERPSPLAWSEPAFIEQVVTLPVGSLRSGTYAELPRLQQTLRRARHSLSAVIGDDIARSAAGGKYLGLNARLIDWNAEGTLAGRDTITLVRESGEIAGLLAEGEAEAADEKIFEAASTDYRLLAGARRKRFERWRDGLQGAAGGSGIAAYAERLAFERLQPGVPEDPAVADRMKADARFADFRDICLYMQWVAEEQLRNALAAVHGTDPRERGSVMAQVAAGAGTGRGELEGFTRYLLGLGLDGVSLRIPNDARGRIDFKGFAVAVRSASPNAAAVVALEGVQDAAFAAGLKAELRPLGVHVSFPVTDGGRNVPAGETWLEVDVDGLMDLHGKQGTRELGALLERILWERTAGATINLVIDRPVILEGSQDGPYNVFAVIGLMCGFIRMHRDRIDSEQSRYALGLRQGQAVPLEHIGGLPQALEELRSQGLMHRRLHEFLSKARSMGPDGMKDPGDMPSVAGEIVARAGLDRLDGVSGFIATMRIRYRVARDAKNIEAAFRVNAELAGFLEGLLGAALYAEYRHATGKTAALCETTFKKMLVLADSLATRDPDGRYDLAEAEAFPVARALAAMGRREDAVHILEAFKRDAAADLAAVPELSPENRTWILRALEDERLVRPEGIVTGECVSVAAKHDYVRAKLLTMESRNAGEVLAWLAGETNMLLYLFENSGIIAEAYRTGQPGVPVAGQTGTRAAAALILLFQLLNDQSRMDAPVERAVGELNIRLISRIFTAG